MPNIYDVAKRANVSISTVSRVLNKTGQVSGEKTTRVLQAVKELGYIPNKPARSLMTKRMGLIGVVVPDISNPFYHPLYR